MTNGDLERIEKELNLVLPRSYREFMQSGKFGEGYQGTQDLTGTADEVVEWTKELRSRGFYGAKWPDNFVVVGDDGAGDSYFIDVQKERPAVFLADHELTTNKDRLILDEREQYETFSQFWEHLQRNYEATDRAIERQRNKKWWQFWIQKFGS